MTRKLGIFSTSLALTGALCVAQALAQNLNVPRPGQVAAPTAADGNLGAAVLIASINSTGTILHGEGVQSTGTSRLSAGVYEVGFVRNITNCVYSISPGEGLPGAATPLMAGITGRSGNPNGVFVRIANNANTPTDSAFFVVVNCGR